MSSLDLSHDVYRSRLQTVIESLRYWIPSIADAARVEETEAPEYWKMWVSPAVAGACPFELILRSDRRCDLVIAGEVYEDLAMLAFEDFLPLCEAIAQGRVIQRRWTSPATAALCDVETIVTFANSKTWTGSRAVNSRTSGPISAKVSREAAARHDRHFLAYRR